MPLRILFGIVSGCAGIAAMIGGLVALQSRPFTAVLQILIGWLVINWVFEPFEPSPPLPFFGYPGLNKDDSDIEKELDP